MDYNIDSSDLDDDGQALMSTLNQQEESVLWDGEDVPQDTASTLDEPTITASPESVEKREYIQESIENEEKSAFVPTSESSNKSREPVAASASRTQARPSSTRNGVIDPDQVEDPAAAPDEDLSWMVWDDDDDDDEEYEAAANSGARIEALRAKGKNIMYKELLDLNQLVEKRAQIERRRGIPMCGQYDNAVPDDDLVVDDDPESIFLPEQNVPRRRKAPARSSEEDEQVEHDRQMAMALEESIREDGQEREDEESQKRPTSQQQVPVKKARRKPAKDAHEAHAR